MLFATAEIRYRIIAAFHRELELEPSLDILRTASAASGPAWREIPVGRQDERCQDFYRPAGQIGPVRAVANACVANPLAAAIPSIPCGIDRKRALIERECAGV